MLFKIDENLPVEAAELLVQGGYDAKTVVDQRLQGSEDPSLLDICRRERRALITLDLDFSDIRTYPPQENEGIVVLRVANQSKPHIYEPHSSHHLTSRPRASQISSLDR